MADRVAAGLSCYRGKRRLLRCGGWEGEQVSAASAGRRRHDQHGNPAGDRVDRDDSLFPLGSGPLYLGWDPCYRAAVLPWRPAVRRVGAAKCFVYSDWEALLPNRVITAVSGRLQKILANYATKFAA